MDRAVEALTELDRGGPGDGVAAHPTNLVTPRSASPSPGLFKELLLHLVKRQLDSTHRMTVLGWAWPLMRQLMQLAVLVFIFGSVLDLEIDNFPVFVFSGLIAWTWFSTGISTATSSLLDERHLLYYPRLPPAVIPIVAIFVPLIDVLMALPVLGGLLLVESGVPVTILFLPVLVAVQLLLMAGLAWFTSAASVFLRDVPNVVLVVLTVLFYMTPVFYGVSNIPDRYTTLLELNPMATIVTSYRWLLLGEARPGTLTMAYTLGISLVILVGGYLFFARSQDRFIDNL